MSMQGAVFDMDGTLLDSMEVWATAGERYLRARGIVPCGGDKDSLLHQGMIGAVQYYRQAYGIAEDIPAVIDGINEVAAVLYAAEAVPCEGVIDFLTSLKAHGVKLCVATATDRRLAEPTLARVGLLPFFDRIFTCGELQTDKTSAYIFDTAAAFMGTAKEQTWIFEDASYAVRTAKAAGYPVCAVYDRFEPRAAYLKDTADRYIHSYREITAADF